MFVLGRMRSCISTVVKEVELHGIISYACIDLLKVYGTGDRIRKFDVDMCLAGVVCSNRLL